MDNIKIKELAKTAVGKEFTLKGEIKVSEKVSSNNGNKYLSVEINDGTGVIYDNIFDDRGKLYDEVKNLDNAGRYEITGKIRSVREGTKGFNAIIISKIDLIKGSIKITKDKKELSDEFKKIFKTITNKAYRDLITKCFKEIEQDIFYTVPVSENHYLYKGGLADHIIRTNEIINSIVDSYKGGLNYDKDLLTTATLLFRIGKTKTLKWEKGRAQLTEEGVLFEDSSITHDIVAKCLQGSTLNDAQKMCLLHTIDASKYKPEYGALAEPKTKEAFLLYYAEMLSLNEAKFQNLKDKVLDEDNNIIYGPNHSVLYMTENLSEKSPKENEE